MPPSSNSFSFVGTRLGGVEDERLSGAVFFRRVAQTVRLSSISRLPEIVENRICEGSWREIFSDADFSFSLPFFEAVFFPHRFSQSRPSRIVSFPFYEQSFSNDDDSFLVFFSSGW